VDPVNVFQFMVVRAPEVPAATAARRNLIRDDVLRATGRVERDLFSDASASAIGQLIYRIVFCSDAVPGFSTDFDYVLAQLLPSLISVETPCPTSELTDPQPLLQMPDRETLFHAGVHHLIPNRLDDLPTGTLPAFFGDVMRAVERALDDPSSSRENPWVDRLMATLRAIRDDTPLYATIFMPAGGTAEWLDQAKAALFDALYRLYVLRRRVPASLDEFIRALQLLHAIEALAVDELVVRASQQRRLSREEQAMLQAVKADYQDLGSFPPPPLPPRFPLIRGAADLATYMDARPVIHPLFARLHGFRKPFNPVRRIGTGDLKVVKQRLIGYEVGEIAHIENVLLGENRSRVHRRLEKTEDVFTTTSEETSETQEDTQTTDRYELKRETDNLVNTSLNVNANLGLNVTYDNSGTGYTIVTSANGGFAYNRSQTDQVKATTNFARDVVDKAVKRIETRVSRQRTTTKLFETEETTTHGFKNVPGKTHVSGIYRWLDKRYRAQVFNYGKRMMFEFLVPEPAAFLV
jgi:hypothetical protein